MEAFSRSLASYTARRKFPATLLGGAAAWPRTARAHDPPPLKWSDLRYVFDIKEDCNDKEAIQA